MKIISLNIWNGRLPTELSNFFQKYSGGVEVFCLQEVFSAHNITVDANYFDSPQKISQLIDDEYTTLTDNNGLMLCFKKEIILINWGITEVFSQGDFRKNLLWAQLQISGEEYFIGNVHGIWVKDSREDTSDRLEQSRKIIGIINSHKNKIILCGDFNLMPETKSIGMIEQKMVNLIKKYNISRTRTKLKKQTDRDKNAEEFADYVFTSSDINVINFSILAEEVSDHFALMVEI